MSGIQNFSSTRLLAGLLALTCFVAAVQPYGIVFTDDEIAAGAAQPMLFNRIGRMDPSWVQMGFGKRSGDFDKRQQVKLQRGYSAIGLGRR
ncbi:hypothetical protein L596_030695 [Steinernema carpocapsae]|uniref:Uncharacterized protein n=1 Tax=Steinernema carpocapsae TaxID=34508 RepID=A0A4U5LNH3_STECR|nr:hypothetical protein L596_030695 [Steinernema carpocapsae]